ncbi:hypothetical protein FRC16_005185 [Serendipita sp. 398]|nr:hypothetical protein FRC16_005185 [Serendipita sp. 398]
MNINTRRSTQPNLFPPTPDTNTQRSKERSGSPLRHSITASPHSEDGSPLPGRYDGDPWGGEPTSPTLGTTFARVANSIVSSIRSPSLKPTDEEIEAEAIRERERSRREAERILTQEAEERRVMEEKILALRNTARNNSQTSLPLPQSAQMSTSYSGNSPRKEDSNIPGWWQSAKNRLGSSKELTPAQQIIQDTKVKEKETKKTKYKEPKTPTKKSSDSANLHLDIPHGGYRPGSTSSAETSPSRERPSASRENSGDGNRGASPSGRSTKDDNPPIYAKFNAQGALDVHETLLTLTRRFEKLERWTVGHVRALEDRVGDVEKWLVDKEEARQAADETRQREAAESKRVLEETKAKMDEIRRIADEAKRYSSQAPKNIQQAVESEVEKAVAGIRRSTGRTPIDLARVASVSPPGSLTSSSRMRHAQDASPSASRVRAQSAYGAPSGWGSISQGLEDTPPLRPRRRSGDIREGEFGAVRPGTSASATGSTSNKFVDPLLLRKKEKEVGPPKLPVARGSKANFGDLLAFFDGDRK